MRRINENYYAENYRQTYENIKYYNVKECTNIKVYGLYDYKNQSVFKRIPDDVAEATSYNVSKLYTNPSGGRIRFVTDSDVFSLKVLLPGITDRSIMSTLCSKGFDLYIMKNGKETYKCSLFPPIDAEGEYIIERRLPDGEKEITLYMPLYNDVKDVYIGIDKDKKILPHIDYKVEKPFLFYGSSITQGACVSRPGNTYQAMLSRDFDLNFINLGFAGSALAEDTIVDYMADMDYSVFVSDYDFNAPSVEHLENTHFKMYQKIREKHPDVPYIMLSKPIITPDNMNEYNEKRRKIVYNSYLKAKEQGDDRVYFIDGFKMFEDYTQAECCADGTHPNDLGAFIMYRNLKEIIEKEKILDLI